MLNTLKSIKFRLSDLFLVFWVIFGSLIFIEDYRFISYHPANRLDFNLPFPIILLFFALLIVSLICYLILEFRKCTLNFNKFLYILPIFIIVSQLETILGSPNLVEVNITDIFDYPVTVMAIYSTQVKCIHFFTSFFIITTIFISLFILPKRIKRIKSFEIIIYVAYIAGLIALIYSLVNDDYITFFKVLFFKGEAEVPLKFLCPKSFFGNPNVYGMFVEVCLFGAIFNYYLTKKKFNIVIAVIFYVLLLITVCKAGILSSTLGLLMLVIFNIIKGIIKKDKKRVRINSVILTAFVSTFIIMLILFLTVFTNINVFEAIGSFTGRTEMWKSSLEIIGDCYSSGLGYGIYHTLVANCSRNFNLTYSPVSHNSFILFLGMGGLVMVIPYLILIIYTIYLLSKNMFKHEPVIPIGCAYITFFIHSLFEDNYYLLIGTIVMLFIALSDEEVIKNN